MRSRSDARRRAGDMPIYEFRCNRCGRRTSIFVRSMSSPVSAVCEHCGSGEMSRLISRVTVLRSEDAIFSGVDDNFNLDGVDQDDPRAVARWVRTMNRQMGESLDPEMDAELERMESGELSEDFGRDEAEDAFGEE